MSQTHRSTMLYAAAQLREFDRRAIETYGIAGSELMTRAGTAAFRALRARMPRARRIAVICGPGNNGGDGYVVARLAREAGLVPTVVTLGNPSVTSRDAAAMRACCEAAGVIVQAFDVSQLEHTDVIVDALLGIGLARPVQNEWRNAIEAINVSAAPVLAIDIPSGLHAESGAVMGAAVRAEVTISFIGLKAGLFTGSGREHAGEILFDDLGLPPDAYNGIVPIARRLSEDDLHDRIPRRARDAHKGSFGHVLVVGGAPGMTGAARLCGQSAARLGSGLVTLATHPESTQTIDATRPELLAYATRSAKDLKPLLERATVVALGPGLSQSTWARAMFRAVLASKRALVVDADALNLLAREPVRRSDWILTPHPGEAARLLKTTAAGIQQDRSAAIRALVKRYGGVCVLKGAGTLVASEADDTVWLCDRGNPGMASGGTGDVLTGAIAALRAQGLTPLDAARLGVWLHAGAGDRAAQHEGQIGLLAGDLIPEMRHELNRLVI